MTREHSIELTRQELYDKVWEQSMTKLATEIGLSDVGLAKVCRKYDIPQPPVGYWAKLSHGKEVERPPLPDLDDEALSEIISFQENFDKDGPGARRANVVVIVPEKLTKPHEHICATKAALRLVQPDDHGVVSAPKSDCLNINVSRKSLPRALRIFDTIINAWESEGGDVRIENSEFCLGDDGVCVSLNETGRRYEEKQNEDQYWKDLSYEAAGKLSLEISGYAEGLRKTWKDGKVQLVENVLGSFITILHEWMEYQKLRRLDFECSDRQKQKASQRRSSAKVKKDLEMARRSELMSFVKSWEKAERIRCYLNAVETKIESKEVASSNPESFAKWLEWAYSYADHVCPITASTVRKESIEFPENCRIEVLDLTRKTRAALSKFPIQTTNELFEIDRDQFSRLCEDWYRPIWEEVNLVLEGLGYDVSRRKSTY